MCGKSIHQSDVPKRDLHVSGYFAMVTNLNQLSETAHLGIVWSALNTSQNIADSGCYASVPKRAWSEILVLITQCRNCKWTIDNLCSFWMKMHTKSEFLLRSGDQSWRILSKIEELWALWDWCEEECRCTVGPILSLPGEIWTGNAHPVGRERRSRSPSARIQSCVRRSTKEPSLWTWKYTIIIQLLCISNYGLAHDITLGKRGTPIDNVLASRNHYMDLARPSVADSTFLHATNKKNRRIWTAAVGESSANRLTAVTTRPSQSRRWNGSSNTPDTCV